MDFGDWSIRNWRSLAGLTSAVLIVLGGLAGSITDYTGYFSALGGPNGLLYDVTLKVAQPWRRNIPTVPAVFVAIDDASLATPDLAARNASARSARRAPNATATTASTACAARPRCAARVSRATSPDWRASATRSGTGRWSPTTAARPIHPADSTAPATAPALAVTPPTPTAAVRPPAPARRSHRSGTVTAPAPASSRRSRVGPTRAAGESAGPRARGTATAPAASTASPDRAPTSYRRVPPARCSCTDRHKDC